jgi:tetratricopeptide (TPR) repeat protein
LAAPGTFCGPAVMAARHWEELAWAPRSWESSDLPAGWGKGCAVLATDAGSGMPVVVSSPAGTLPLIGREPLFRDIDAVAGEAEGGEGRAVLLTGDLGLGKSEAVNEMVTRLVASGRFLLVRLTFPPAGHLRGGLRQALDGVLGTTGRSALHVRQVVKDFLRRHGEEDAQEVRDLVGFLRPAGPDQAEQGSIFALVHRCLQRLSRSRPVLLCADDIQRGGPDAVAFLEFLLFQIGFEPFPILILAAVGEDGRGDAFDLMLERLARFEGSTLRSMRLAPLPEDTLAAALIEHMGVGRTRARQIARRAAGNPLFAMYLARATSTSQSATDERRMSLDERVPRALHELLAITLRKRLARAPDAQRVQTLLESMAILGAVVDLSLVAAFLADDIPAAQMERDLDVCLDLGLLQWIGAGDAELVSFVPEVLRDVLIDGLNPRRARRLHQRAIEVRKVWAGERVDAEAGALGDHCEAAGRHDEAVTWWLRGQRYELAGGNALRGVEWGLKALRALDVTDLRHGTCAMVLGRILLDAGDLVRAEEVLLPVVDGADADLAMRAGDVLGDVYENRGARDKWTRLIERLSAREAEASPEGRRFLYLARALWQNSRGQPQEGERDARRALDSAVPGEQAQRAAQRLAFSYLVRGDLVQAEAMARRALDESGERLDLRLRSLRALAIMLMFQGRLDEAARHQQEVLRICRRSGLVARIPFALSELGDTLRAQGRFDEAQAQYEAAERAAQELGLGTQLGLIHLRQLTCDLLQGRTDGVQARIRSTAASLTEIGLGVGPRFCALLETWAYACEGHLDLAVDAYERVGALQDLVIDPQLVQILEAIAERLVCAIEAHGGGERRAVITVRSILGDTAEVARRTQAPGYAERIRSLLDRLP